MLLGARPRQRVVAPLAADAARTVDQGAVATSPPPQPVPRMTPKTVVAPAPAPSTASERAKQLASLASRTGRPRWASRSRSKRLAVQPRRVGVLHEPARRCHRAGYADADAASSPPLAPPPRARSRRWRGWSRRNPGAATPCDARPAARPPAPSTTPAILVPPRSIPVRKGPPPCPPAVIGPTPRARQSRG